MDFFINMSNGIHNHFTTTDNDNAVSGVDWPKTLGDLVRRQKGAPQIGRVEINCHGSAGTLYLDPIVNGANLHKFAGLLRQLVAPGSMIEILACRVASYDYNAMTSSIPKQDWATASWELSNDMYYNKETTRVTPYAVTAIVRKAIRMGRQHILAGDNGPLFCARLATATGSRVRAAMIVQLEDGEDSGDSVYDNPIGDWEGHVLDFGPGDFVRYAGFNLPRPVFRVNRLPIQGLPRQV